MFSGFSGVISVVLLKADPRGVKFRINGKRTLKLEQIIQKIMNLAPKDNCEI
jgi:hypothetical protein